MTVALQSPSADTDLSGVATILLAGGKGTRLHELTVAESKPAVFFAGANRIIDFSMANAARAGLSSIIVATQFAPDTLHAHLPHRWAGHFPQGNLLLRDGRNAYLGTADAVRRNWAEIEALGATEILVLAADHIYEMDYGALIADHRRSGADVTVAVDVVPRAEASGFGVMHARADGRIIAFHEKPANPPSIEGQPDKSLASMGIYVFSRAWLQSALAEDEDATDFGHHIIPHAVEQGGANAWRLPPSAATGKSYWRDVGTLDALRLAHLDFAAAPPVVLPSPQSGHKWRFGADSIVMPGATTSSWVRLSRAIVAPGAKLPPGLVVGEDPLEDRKWFRRTAEGTILITQPMLDRRAEQRSPTTMVTLRRASRNTFSPAGLRPAMENRNA